MSKTGGVAVCLHGSLAIRVTDASFDHFTHEMRMMCTWVKQKSSHAQHALTPGPPGLWVGTCA
jgi:hypothetical protein